MYKAQKWSHNHCPITTKANIDTDVLVILASLKHTHLQQYSIRIFVGHSGEAQASTEHDKDHCTREVKTVNFGKPDLHFFAEKCQTSCREASATKVRLFPHAIRDCAQSTSSTVGPPAPPGAAPPISGIPPPGIPPPPAAW